MKINFNTNIYNPNFKASFAKDNKTLTNLYSFTLENPTYTLATHNALKDIESNDEVALRMGKNWEFIAKNVSNGNELVLGRNLRNATTAMLNLFTEPKTVKRFFDVSVTPKANMLDYLKVADKVVAKKASNSKDGLALIELEKTQMELTKQRAILNKEIARNVEKIQAAKYAYKNNLGHDIFTTKIAK